MRKTIQKGFCVMNVELIKYGFILEEEELLCTIVSGSEKNSVSKEMFIVLS